MENQQSRGFNPYLPSWEYVPDGEPHVFGDRVYVYGSHDRFNGYAFCLNDYVSWSAPVDDLTKWRYEGVLYRRGEAPYNEDGERALYAPDCTQGPDGRYYLYYALNGLSIISAAVCDTPAGKFKYYGDVHYPDGTRLGEREGDQFQFDPGVYTEGDVTWLYSGFCPAAIAARTGAQAIRLGADMLTITQDPVTVVPSPAHASGTGFEGHAFFEASSMRKVNGKYCFIYSSELSHELCYAMSDHPDRDFVYGGTIISNADIGLPGVEKPVAPTGNNHGSIEQIAGQWYVFYHRQTNSSSYSRQGCIEPIEILPDGSITQVPVTSCGPNGGPLPGEGEYPAYIACNLYMTQLPMINTDAAQNPFPRITQETADVGAEDHPKETSYISTLTPGVMIGFKYFDCKDIKHVSVRVRGQCYAGGLTLYTDPNGEPLGTVAVNSSNEWHWDSADICIPDGVQAIYFKADGFGIFSLAAFRLEK